MEALSYLLKRYLPPASLASLALFLASCCGWLSIWLSSSLPRAHPHIFRQGFYSLGWSIIVILGGILSFGSLLALLLLPFYISRLSYQRLKIWKNKRILDELLLTNLSPNQLINYINTINLKWWLIVAMPTAIASIFFFQLKGLYIDPGSSFTIYLAVGAALITLSINLGTAQSLERSRYKLLFSQPFWFSLVLVAAILTMSKFKPLGWFVAGLYSCFASYQIAVLNLKKQANGSHSKRARSTSRQGNSSSYFHKMPANAIAFRQAIVASSNTAPRILGGLVALTAGAICLRLSAVWPIFFLVFPLLALISLRSTFYMANIINVEKEHSTIDTIRATPLGPASYLRGWSLAALKLAWTDGLLLLFCCSALLILLKQGRLLLDPKVFLVAYVALILPTISVFIGAALAKQNKSREEILGQAFIVFAILGAVVGPQSIAFAKIFSLKASLLTLTLAGGAAITLLRRLAIRSLEEALAPQ